MKKDFTSLELHYIVKELQDLVNARVDKIYHPKRNYLVLQLFISSKGKRLLKIELPHFLYVTKRRLENPERPSNFCLILRKALDNSFLRSFSQKDSERIVELIFEKRNTKFILIIELFSKGNIILCKDNYTIIVPLFVQRWKQRNIKRGELYKFPPPTVNFLKIKQKEFCDIIQLSQKDSLVKTFAIDLGLGGVYAEELCLISGINKNSKNLTQKELNKLFFQFQRLLQKKPKPYIVYDKENIINIVPFDLLYYKDNNKKYFKSYNESLDYGLQSGTNSKEEKQFQSKLERLQRIIEKQQSDIMDMKMKLKINEYSAELLYNNYQLVTGIIKEIKKASNKYSWQEIKEKLKGNKIVKEVNAKDKTIVLELK